MPSQKKKRGGDCARARVCVCGSIIYSLPSVSTKQHYLPCCFRDPTLLFDPKQIFSSSLTRDSSTPSPAPLASPPEILL